MPQEAWSPKRERQYEHVKEGLQERGRPTKVAKEIAARTVNKERARSGESDQARSSSTNDISSGRRGGLRSHRGTMEAAHGTNCTPRPTEEHQGPVQHVEGATGVGPGWPLSLTDGNNVLAPRLLNTEIINVVVEI